MRAVVGYRREPVVSLLIVLALMGLLSAPGLSFAQQRAMVEAEGLPPVLTGPYRVNVGDELEISFFKTSDLDQVRTVGPDGEIFLTLIGRVRAVDRTLEDITRELNERYAEEMVNPQITVSVSEFSGLRVFVSGEVKSPGIREYRGDITLVQAIFDAGGFTSRARRSEVLLIRRSDDDTPVGSIVNVKQILRKGQLQDDVLLAPMDTIYVHHKKIVNVNLFVQQYISDNLPRFGEWFYWVPAYRNTAN